MSAATFFTFMILLWGVGTTIYGLYLSRKNNEEYNKNIVLYLKALKEHFVGVDVVDLSKELKPKPKDKGFEIRFNNPFKKKTVGTNNDISKSKENTE